MSKGVNKSIRVGDEMPDGTVYAGVSPDTGKAMYVTPSDAPGAYTFNKAARYAKKLDAHGHKDFRVPSEDELNVLYENRNRGKLKGTFNESGSEPDGFYWSSEARNSGYALGQRFSDGALDDDGMDRDDHLSLRCVRP